METVRATVRIQQHKLKLVKRKNKEGLRQMNFGCILATQEWADYDLDEATVNMLESDHFVNWLEIKAAPPKASAPVVTKKKRSRKTKKD